jgi:hypothetical protein
MTKEEIYKWHQEHPYGARDAAYVDAVLAKLREIWLEFPQERLGQLIVNLASDIEMDPFNILDEELVD